MSEATENNEAEKPKAESPAAILTDEQIEKIRAKISAKQARDRARVLDPQDPFYLAGFLPFGPDEFETYTPEWARKAGKKISYNIRPFSRETVKKIDASQGQEQNRAAVLEGFKEGAITGWERETFKGAPIPFSKEAIDTMPDADFAEIGQRCYAYATGILPEEREGLG